MEWYWIVAIAVGSLALGVVSAIYLMALGMVELFKELLNR